MSKEETFKEMTKAVSALQRALDKHKQATLSPLELGREVPFEGITFKDSRNYPYVGTVSIKGVVMSWHFEYPSREEAIAAARRLCHFKNTE